MLKRSVLIAAFLFAAATLAHANPIVPDEYYTRKNAPVFIVWCVLGSILIFGHFKHMYAGLIPLAFGVFAVRDPVALLTWWRISLVVLIFWLAIQQPPVRDWEWMIKYGFHAAFFAIMVVFYHVRETYYDGLGEKPNQELMVTLAKTGIITVVGLGLILIAWIKSRKPALLQRTESASEQIN